MCAMKIKTEQQLLTNKFKEVGNKKKMSVNRLLKYPPGEGKNKMNSGSCVLCEIGLFLFVIL